MIDYASQFITRNDINSINKILRNKFLTQGPITLKFENKISKLCNAKYSVSVNSASSGLLLACKVLNLKKMILFGQHPIHLQQQLMQHYIVNV